MSVFDHPEFDQHEAVHFFHDSDSGLNAIIALHSTALGPAAGGCRRWTYADSDLAITDVLRLSRGMTYKNAVAGLPFGGGKSVILASDDAPKSPELFDAFGKAVDSLQGNYITAEDVGISVDDMKRVRRQTPYVTGVAGSDTTAGGDPSPWTALGVFLGIEAAVKVRLGADSLKGIRVAVQGIGSVGMNLCRLLHEAGAELVVSDINADSLDKAYVDFGASVVDTDEILLTECDVLSPCALGDVLNADSIPQLNTKIVAGAANNQLGKDSDGAHLLDREILYAPDYVINAGGIIAVAREYFGGSSEAAVRQEIGAISQRAISIFEASAASGESTNRIADNLARSIVSNSKKKTHRLIA